MLGGGEVVAHVVDGPAAEHVGRCGRRGRGRAPPSTCPRRPVRWPRCRPRSARRADPRVRRSPTASATASTVAGSARSRRVATSGSSRWWRTIATSTSTSAGGSPMRAPIVPHELHADLGVVARIALADVVEQRAEHEQIGSVGARHERRGVGARLHQVPVDREAVVGVALGLAADRLPLGEHLHPQAHLVERLDHRDGAVPGEEQVDECPRARRRPRAPAARRPRRPADRASRGGSGCRRPRPPRRLAAPRSGRPPGRRRR